MTPGPTTKMDRSMVTGGGGSAGTTDQRKRCGETIHSGQFMVSHFETEGAEDDDDDLGMQMEEVKPADLISADSAGVILPVSASGALSDVTASTSSGALVPMASIGTAENQNQLARYVPRHVGNRNTVSQVEIDTDLSTVFNTLNVTYTQKLTSPKWNPFKGIRLRWKEKIRLNNVIWRCWHMQFIMKRKTLVCQFASPLDVDVHNTPQAILLEGKYWKRKCNVIKAEYKKWRRFNVNRALGATNIVDTNSELDFLEWSPISNDIFMITDNMPTDTLFSTLAQYPFPDSREIARGAGRADFIQPSLGPLQPNLDDLMDLDLDFLNFSRLAPVPEEASDDLLKAIDYNYTLGSNQLTNAGSSIQEAPGTLQAAVSGSNQQTNQTGGCIQQQPAGIQYSAKIYAQTLQPSSAGSPSPTVQSSIAQQLSNAIDTYLSDQLIGGGSQTGNNQPTASLGASLGIGQVASSGQPHQQHTLAGGNSSDELARSVKSKFSRGYAKHNYDPKYPPTPHQTMAYNMVSQPHMGQAGGNSAVLGTSGPYGSNATGGFQNVISSSASSSSSTSGILQMGSGGGIPSSLTPGSMQLHYNHSALQNVASNPVNLSNSPGATSAAGGAGGNGGGNIRTTSQMGTTGVGTSAQPNVPGGSVMLLQSINSKLLTHSQSLPVPALPQAKPAAPQPRSTSMPTGPNYNQMLASQHSPPGSLHASQSGSSYKSYHGHQPQPYKIPSQTVGAGGSYASGVRAMRHSSPPHGTLLQPTTGSTGPSTGHGMSANTVGISNALEQSQQQLQDLQLQQQQQQQQQQQSIVSTAGSLQQQQQTQAKRHPPHPTKEMFRSNSLPINATFPLPPKEAENFAMPRYHQSSQKANAKLRTRSNSMIMKQQTGVITNPGIGMMGSGSSSSSTAMAGGGSSQHVMSPTLHATSSEPMLNVTNSALLAQLLTTNNASTLLSKQSHSTSSSAISTLTQSSSQQQQQQHQQQTSLFQTMSMGNTISPSSSQLQLHQLQQQQQQQHHHHQMSNATPGTSSSTMRAQPSHSSVLNFASSAGMSLSQQSLSPDSAHDTDGPLSPTGLGGSGSTSTGGAGSKFPRSDSQRRTGHIHAEQKRRYNIKNGFDTLHSLIPQLQQNPNAKLSKAAMLQKGADYIKQLRTERTSANDQMDALRREIDQLNNSLNNLHTALPASGAPVSRQRTGRVKDLYQHYVRQRTLENWKFWIFGLIFEPLLNSYNQTVSVASMDEMYRTSQLWVDQHCSLVELRPAVSNQLRQLSTTTDVLSDPPSSLQEEVLKAISNANNNSLVPRGSGQGSSRGGSSTETSPHRS